MSNKVIVGLTGPTGSGKSTIAKLMGDKGCFIIDADKISRELTQPGHPCVDELIKEFGQDIKNKDGGIKRKLLAQKAFSSQKNLMRLNEITHPIIISTIKSRSLDAKDNQHIIVIDAPLLIESGLDSFCDIIITATASKETRLKRIIKRDNLEMLEAINRMHAQHDEEYYNSKADYIFDTEIVTPNLRQQIKTFIRTLKGKSYV